MMALAAGFETLAKVLAGSDMDPRSAKNSLAGDSTRDRSLDNRLVLGINDGRRQRIGRNLESDLAQ